MRKSAFIVCLVTVMTIMMMLAGSPTFAQSEKTIVMENLDSTTGMSLNSARPAHVEYVSDTSELVGKEIDTIMLKLRKIGTPTGTAEVGIVDGNLELKKVFGTIDASSVATSYTDYTFSLSSENDGYILQPGDGIGIVYFGGDSSNLLTVMRDTAGNYDRADTHHRYYTDKDHWTNQFNADLYMQLATDKITRESKPKYVMIHFDDGRKSQYDYALPILNQYNIKATFWIVCDYASGTSPGYMHWSEIDQLVTQGHDIQNHGMSHKHLPTLSNKQLSKEIGDCKSIVMKHGSTGDAFAIPFNDGDDDQRVVTAISKFHNYGKGDGGAPQPANCGIDGCEILKEDGTFNKDSKYAMKQWSHDTYSQGRTEAQILDGFIEAVNRGKVDSNGNLVQFTIITYHKVNEGAGSPSSALFESEMRYLRDNGFTALGMDDIRYDSSSGRFKLR